MNIYLTYSLKVPVLCITLITLLGACASSQPILYPNEQAKEVGNEQVRKDINECTKLAKDSGASSSGAAETAKETAGSATEGAATGAATGAVTGNAGTAAAVGAISRGMSRLFSGMRQNKGPSAAYKEIVERCLRDKGYEPVGWK
jgi:hypothetical protein